MKTIRIIIILLLCNISLYAQHQNLDKQQKSIASISALTAKSDWVGLKTELSKGLDNGLTINQIKEELVHLYAYVGFPKSIMGLRTFLTVLDERKANDIKDNWGKEASPIDDTNPKYVRGKKVLEELSKHRKEVRDHRDSLNKINDEKESWFQKKKEYSQEIVRIVSEIKTSKENRDNLTGSVKKLKADRDELRSQISKRIKLLMKPLL